VTALLRVTMLAPVVDEVPAKAPTGAGPKKERKRRAQVVPTPAQAAPVEVDAAKDKALIDGFSAAVAAAIGTSAVH